MYFKFHENCSRGIRAVVGRKSPSPIDLAHGLYKSLYYPTSRDVTVATTLADSYLQASSVIAAAAASRKEIKYSDLPASFSFQPIAVETSEWASRV